MIGRAWKAEAPGNFGQVHQELSTLNPAVVLVNTNKTGSLLVLFRFHLYSPS